MTGFLGQGTFSHQCQNGRARESWAAELLHYRQTRIDSVGRKVNIPHASEHRFTNTSSSVIESRRFIPQACQPIYRGVPKFVVFSYCGCVQFSGWRCLVFHLLLSTCKTKRSTENHFHSSRNNWRLKNDLQTLNNLYEVTVSELEMIAFNFQLQYGN